MAQSSSKFKLLNLLFLVCLFTCCSNPEVDSEHVSSVGSIEFSKDQDLTPVIGTQGGEASITFTATDDWFADVTAVTRSLDWLSLSPTNGKAGMVTLQIKVQPNDSYDERNAAILLNCGKDSKSITFTQKQKNALLVTSNKVEIGAQGGSFSIEMQTNVGVSYEIDDFAKEWLFISSSSTRGLISSTLDFQVAENNDVKPRQATITLSGGEVTEQVVVYQAGSEPTIILSQNEYVVSSQGETIKIELRSNTSYEVKMPDVFWINESLTRSMSAYTHYFTIDANDTYDSRSAEIIFCNKDSGIEETVLIKQVQKDAILVAQNEYTVKSQGEILNFSVNTNVDFNIETSVDWIKNVKTRGLSEKPLQFVIDANDTGINREGEIFITHNELKQTIKIIQSSLDLELEREALIAFYQIAGGENWLNKTNWCSDKPLNEWFGISVNSAGQVISVVLQENGVKGDIGDLIHTLTPLTELKKLYLSQSNTEDIYGSISDDIYNFTNMEYLRINNELSGVLDERIAKLKKLKELDLTGVIVSSSVLRQICNSLTDLYTLQLTNCNIDGPIPDEIGNLKNLRLLGLIYGDIEGTIPESIWSLSLNSLSFQGNSKLHGNISPNIKNLNNLMFLSIQNCSLSGEIPDEICQCSELTQLWLQGNKLEGDIPTDIGNLKNMFSLELQNNNLTGTLPVSMSQMSSLVVCNLYGNRLSGSVPEDVSNIWNKWSPLSYIIPQQEGYILTYKPIYSSTDYSKDGEVKLLQRHTDGKGIPIIFLGDAFVDTDMDEGGYYDVVMNKAMEAFFSIEPMISLRNLFDVYSVRCVSENNFIGGNTALSSKLPTDNEQDGGDVNKCLEYALYAVEDLENVSINVIVNENQQMGFTYMLDDLCTISFTSLHESGLDWQNFLSVFRHEGIGHGFGLLGDEYGHSGVLNEQGKQTILQAHQIGKFLNLDVTDSQTDILWKNFLTDSRYENEDLGIYEGGLGHYAKGIYRPSYVSIMRFNRPIFNAPSREAIYKRAMKLAYGDNWEYDYETFVEFDLSTNANVQLNTNSKIQILKNHQPLQTLPYTSKQILQNGQLIFKR